MRCCPTPPFFSARSHISAVMQALLAAQRTSSGFPVACLPPPHPVPVPTKARPFLPGPLMESGPASPPQLPCSQRKASLSLDSQVLKSLSQAPSFFLPFLPITPPHSLNNNNKCLVPQNMLLSQTLCLCSQCSPPGTPFSSPSPGLKSYPSCKADHKCLFGQKSFPSISPSPEPLQHSLTPLHRP